MTIYSDGKPHDRSPDVDEISHRHSAKNLNDAMQGMCLRFPEESFCFLNEKALYDKARFVSDNFGTGNENNDFTVAYAVKANAKKRILEVLTAAGIKNFDCASPNEIRAVKAVNEKARILYNHPVKKRTDIQAAIAMGVNHFTLQSHAELKKILSVAQNTNLELVVRMETPNTDARIDLSQKFGATAKETGKLLDVIETLPDVACGIAVNTGSQNENPETFRLAIRQIAEEVKFRDNIRFVNLGGGIPVNYFPHDKFDIAEYMAAINSAINELLEGNHEIILEPGRSIVAEAVDLVIPVTSIEEKNGTKCAYIEDGLFTSFSDSAVHGWQYHFKPYSPDGKIFSNETEEYIVFGRTCDSGDLIKGVKLPVDIEEGDYLWVSAAGAYLDSQTTYFNGFEPPRYVSYNTLT